MSKINYDLETVHKIELGILEYLDKICKENNLVYYLGFGTLLGAIRHNGFIPWDDDIDIQMPRPDYEKLLQIFEKKSDQSRYQLATHKNTKNYFLPFAKLYDSFTYLLEKRHLNYHIGIFIDIFPMDGVSPNIEIENKRRKVLTFTNMIITGRSYQLAKMQPIKRIGLRLFSRLVGGRNAANLIIKYAKSVPFENSNEVETVVWGDHRNIKIIQKQYYGTPCIHQFENLQCNIPQEAERILEIIYGNYMELPPKRERYNKHEFISGPIEEKPKNW